MKLENVFVDEDYRLFDGNVGRVNYINEELEMCTLLIQDDEGIRVSAYYLDEIVEPYNSNQISLF